MGMFLGVAQGSIEEPRLIHVWYQPKGAAAKRPPLAIVGKAMALEPQDRYVGAAELGAEVGRFLTGGAVEALPEGPLRRSLRFARRHATPILLVLTYLLVRLALLFFARR